MFVQKNSPSDAHPFRESYSWMTEKMSRGDQTSCNCNYCSHFAMDRRSRLPSLNQIFLYRLKDSSKSMAAFVSQPVSLRPLHVMKHFFVVFCRDLTKKAVSLFPLQLISLMSRVALWSSCWYSPPARQMLTLYFQEFLQ